MEDRKFEIFISIIITATMIILIYFAYLETQKESIHYDALQEKIKIIEHTYGQDFNSYNEYLVYRIEKGE